jgi:hypothetical protein
MLNVSERSVKSPRKVLNEGTPELVAEVEGGRVRISSAAAVARLPEAKQREVVAAGPKAIVAAAKQAVVAPVAVTATDLTKDQRTALLSNMATLKSWIDQHKAEGLNIVAPAVTAAFVAAREAIERLLSS